VIAIVFEGVFNMKRKSGAVITNIQAMIVIDIVLIHVTVVIVVSTGVMWRSTRNLTLRKRDWN
jgi:hypothetical protein